MKIIGINHSGYPVQRNIASLPFKEFKAEKKYDFFKLPDYFIFKLMHKTNQLFFNLHQDFGLSRCDIFHFFNTISFTKKPWITTFETSLPRFGNAPRFFTSIGIKLLARKNCKKLIALSECTKKIQLEFLKNNYPGQYDIIAKKLTVIYPPQKLLRSEYSHKKLDAVLSFMFVGAEFFRKGGMEVLTVFDKLLSSGENIKLYIVSKMEFSGYATPGDCRSAMEIMKKHPGKIIYHSSLPNSEVLLLFSKCHIALLPTYAETFGYTVLEAQASGCPVITTDIRAMPEINSPELGWVIPVPKNELGFGKINSIDEKNEFRDILLAGLENTIRDIIAHPGQIEKKGIACLSTIKEKYSPDNNARTIENIYNEALGKNHV